MEIEVENTFHAPLAHAHELIWGWEIPLYLFLGGLVAGLMILSGYYYLKGKREDYPFTVLGGIVLAPILLSLGMLMLFLDLEYKIHVWRFYAAFELTSPMSWGAWILILIYPACILFILALACEKRISLGPLNHQGERLWNTINSYGPIRMFFKLISPWAKDRIGLLAFANIGLGICLGAYTGILLSSYAARPLWNSQALAPLFLVSGLSSAAALSVMIEKTPRAKHEMARIDRAFIGAELLIIFLIFVNLAYSIRSHQWALEPFIGNALYTPMFWVLVVGLGLILPLLLELLEVKKVIKQTVFVPVLVIVGGIFLRFAFVSAGQVVCWCYYILR